MKGVKHIPFRMTTGSKLRDYVAETYNGNLVGLPYDAYEQGKLKHYDCTFMLDDAREDVMEILASNSDD